MSDKQRALFDITWMYALVGLLGWWVAHSLEGALMLRAGVADLAMTGLIFIFSLWKSNTSAYDAFWSVFPSYLSIWLFFLCDGFSWGLWPWATMLMVNLWSWRLTHNWARGWPGWAHEDWRYVDFRESQGPIAFQFTNFFALHLFSTLIVFAGSLALFDVAQASTFTPWLMVLGLCTGCLGIALELIADNQLAAFRHRPDPKPDDILDSGLWGVMRYPNYLGEMLFWWVSLGAFAMVVLFTSASIPMKDKRMAKRRPNFAEYKARVPALFPKIG